MIGIRIIYPNPLDQSFRHDVVDVRLACSRPSNIRAPGKNSPKKKKTRGDWTVALILPPPRFPSVQLNSHPTYRRALLSEHLEQANVRSVWATCSSCVPAQDIQYSVSIALQLVKIRTGDKIKPKYVQQEFPLPPAVKWDLALFSLRGN